MLFDFRSNNPEVMQFCEEFIGFLCTVIYTMSVFMCGVCSQGVWCGNGDRGGPAFFTAQAVGLSGTGPGDEACEEFAEMFHSTMVRIVRWVISHSFTSLPFSHLSSWPTYSLAIVYFSTLFIPLFYPAFNPQPHPRVSHDACFLFSFLKNLLLEGIAKTSRTVSTNAYD